MNAPAHNDLVELYLTTHFKGVPAAVFFNPLGDGSRPEAIQELFPLAHLPLLISAAIYVHVQPLEGLNKFVNRLDEETYGYVAAWDGNKFTTENT